MSTEKIESLISRQAFSEFDELNSKVEKSVVLFEKLISEIGGLNRSLGGARTIIDISTAVSDLSKKESELAEVSKKLLAAQQQLSKKDVELQKTQKELAQSQLVMMASTEEATKAMTDQSKSVVSTAKALNDLKANLSLVQSEIKGVRKDFDAGKIGVSDYRNKLATLSKTEAEIKESISQANSEMKLQVKESKAAEGSLDDLRAKLALLTKQYDGLGASQRNSAIGKDLKEQIGKTTDLVSNIEQSTGRFQRNVGNYKSALEGVISTLTGVGAALGVIGGVKDIFSDSIEEAEAAEAATYRLKNTLEAFNKSGQFERMAREANNLAKEFRYLDNDDILDLFDRLTTYGKLTQKQIEDLTPVIINFAAKQRISLGEATDIFTKALEGSGKEIKKFGINIKEGSTVGERFNILMTDMKQKVEGAGKAFEQSFTGQIADAKQELKNIEEELGNNWLPMWTELKVAAYGALNGIVISLKNVTEALQSAGEWTRALFAGDLDRLEAKKTLKAKEEEIARINKASVEYADKYVKSITGGLPALQKELDIARQAFALDKERLKQDPRNRDIQISVANSANIIERLKEEIAVLSEKKPDSQNKEDGNGKDKKSDRVKFWDEELKDEAQGWKELSTMQTLELNARLKARKDAAKLELEALTGNYKAERENSKDNAAELIDIDRKYAYDKKKLEIQLGNDLVLIRHQTRQNLVENDSEVGNQFLQEQKDEYEKSLALLTQNDSIRMQEIARNRDLELKLLNDKYVQGRINDEEFAKERVDIEKRANVLVLKEQLDFAKKYLALLKAKGDPADALKIAELEAAIAKAELGLSDILKTDAADKAKEKYEALAVGLEKLGVIYSKVTSLVSGFINARATAQKNAIQDEIDQLDKRTQAEIEAVNASTASQQDKANKITVINARAQAQKEQLERRQRLIDQQRARFEKAAGIGQIIINTAQAVTKALASYNIPQAIAVGALGAAQLAIAIATPLPRFKSGTSDAPGGPAIVGDGGKSELVVTPSGAVIETPARPTIMDVPKHSVILPDASAVHMKNDIVDSNVHFTERDNSRHYEMMGSKLDRLNKTIRDKKEIHLRRTRNGWEYITRGHGNDSKYINR